MMQTQVSAEVWGVIQGLLEGTFPDKLRYGLFSFGTRDFGLYQVSRGNHRDRWSRLNPVAVIESIWDVHSRLRPDDPTLAKRFIPQASSLLRLLTLFRSGQSSDARDKVYSLLSLCRQRAPHVYFYSGRLFQISHRNIH
jgi:hypothetical protein